MVPLSNRPSLSELSGIVEITGIIGLSELYESTELFSDYSTIFNDIQWFDRDKHKPRFKM